jgi:hypothetical protein
MNTDMNTDFDHHGINHMITAISQEMDRGAGKSREDCDTLFIGGPVPSDLNQKELGSFGLRKNWQLIYPSFDTADTSRGPKTFHVVVTDGLAEYFVLQDGRLWKNDRRSQAVLVFNDAGVVVRITGRGRLHVGAAKKRFHDHGYDIALEAVTARAVREPGHIPVFSTIGSLPTVLDITTMNQVFANAA